MGSKKVTLTIDGLDANEKKSSTKIQYVNPNISDDVMRTFANKCAALSNDTHTATTKTTDEDITTAEMPKPKLQLTLGSGTAVLVMKNMNTGAATTCELFSETNLPQFTYKVQSTDEFSCAYFVVCLFTGVMGLTVSAVEDERLSANPAPVTVTIYFEETATTAATTAQVVFSYNNNPALTIL